MPAGPAYPLVYPRPQQAPLAGAFGRRAVRISADGERRAGGHHDHPYRGVGRAGRTVSWLEVLAVIGISGFVIYQQVAGQLLPGKRARTGAHVTASTTPLLFTLGPEPAGPRRRSLTNGGIVEDPARRSGRAGLPYSERTVVRA